MSAELLEFRFISKKLIYHFYINKNYLPDDLLIIWPKVRSDGYVINVPKRFKIRFDKARDPGSQDHIHIKVGGKKLAINEDGTIRHITKGFKISNRLRKILEKIAPHIPIPIINIHLHVIPQPKENVLRTYLIKIIDREVYCIELTK